MRARTAKACWGGLREGAFEKLRRANAKRCDGGADEDGGVLGRTAAGVRKAAL